jgi:hypothetical protein
MNMTRVEKCMVNESKERTKQKGLKDEELEDMVASTSGFISPGTVQLPPTG